MTRSTNRRRTSKRRKGGGFVDTLQGRTRQGRTLRIRDRTLPINPNGNSRFSRIAAQINQPKTPPMKTFEKPKTPESKERMIVYPTGHSYRGDMVNGQPHGTGKLTINGGPTYNGEWKNGKFVPYVEWKKTQPKSQNK